MEVETIGTTPLTLSPELLAKMDAYWRAANYLSVGNPNLIAACIVGDL